MNVNELIERLRELPADAIVLKSFDGVLYETNGVEQFKAYQTAINATCRKWSEEHSPADDWFANDADEMRREGEPPCRRSAAVQIL